MTNRIRFLESKLEWLLFEMRSYVSNQDAQSHLKYGLTTRHYMLRHCREYLNRACFSESNLPLTADDATEASLHLNGYYLNLRGAIDNIAWLLQLELTIIPGITKDTGKGLTRIYLFRDEFKQSLQKIAPDLIRHVLSSENWGKDLAKFRDPASHRIPLYVPPGILTSEEQLKEFRRLEELSGLPEEKLNGRNRLELIIEAHNVAKYKPIFTVTSSSGIKDYNIRKQFIYDHRRYLNLTHRLLYGLKSLKKAKISRIKNSQA